MKPFVIYFPQFYPTPINNEVWGKDFTDWTLVQYANMLNSWKKMMPSRGYYDGSNSNLHLEQFSEINSAGIGGIGLYHYWFYDSHELSEVEKTLLDYSNELNTKWFLIWATENWSKRWIGDSTEILSFSKNPSNKDITQHCVYLESIFSNDKYFKISGKPVFIIYNLGHFSEPSKVVDAYKQWFSDRGITLLIGQFIKNPYEASHSSTVDFNYLFEPRLFFGLGRKFRGNFSKSIFDRVQSLLGGKFINRTSILMDYLQNSNISYSYESFISYLGSDKRQSFVDSLTSPHQDVINFGWNNTPRYGNRFTELRHASKSDCIDVLKGSNFNKEIPLLLNAWNEWSEGAAIEPCFYNGAKYLDAISSIKGLCNTHLDSHSLPSNI